MSDKNDNEDSIVQVPEPNYSTPDAYVELGESAAGSASTSPVDDNSIMERKSSVEDEN